MRRPIRTSAILSLAAKVTRKRTETVKDTVRKTEVEIDRGTDIETSGTSFGSNDKRI